MTTRIASTMFFALLALGSFACDSGESTSSEAAGSNAPAASKSTNTKSKSTDVELLTREPEAVCDAIVPASLRSELGIKKLTQAQVNGSWHECLFDYTGSTEARIAVDIRCADPRFPADWTEGAIELSRKTEKDFKSYEKEVDVGLGGFRAKRDPGHYGPHVEFLTSDAPCIVRAYGADPEKVGRGVDAAVTLEAVK